MMEEVQKHNTTAQNQEIPSYRRRCCIISGVSVASAEPENPSNEKMVSQEQSGSSIELSQESTPLTIPAETIQKAGVQSLQQTGWKKWITICRNKLRWLLAFDVTSLRLPVSFSFRNKLVVKQFLKQYLYHKSRTTLASVFVSLILVAFALILSEFFSAGYAAYINGSYVATISEKSVFEQQIQQLNAEIVTKTGEPGDIPTQVDYVFQFFPKNAISEGNEINTNLLAFSKLLKSAYVISVDSTPVTTVASLTDATASLESVKQQYKNGQPDVTVEILNDIQVESDLVPASDIASISTAAQTLNGQESVEVDYIVQPEDSLWSLAKENNLTIETIQALNPGLNETLVDGSVIRLTQKQPILDVKTVQNASYEETVPPPVNEIQDGNLYEGTTQVVSQGSEGLKMVNAKIVKINGQEVDRMVLSESVVAEPTPSSVVVGTRPIPTGIGSGQFERPYAGVITSRFGSRWGSVHEGIDIGGSEGDPVLSSDEGTVVFAGWNSGGYGNLVILDHGNGYQTYYAHMSEVLVKEGDIVEKGYQIGKLGNTGRSTGPHLHFEVRKDGVPQDPQSYCY